MSTISLTKSLSISLEKAGFDMNNLPKMEVKLLVDKSGSMGDEFRSGWVQNTLDLFLVAALKFDDDGALQVGFFNTGFDQTPDMTKSDAGKYVNKYNIYPSGGTYFAPGIRAFKGGDTSVAPKPATAPGFFGRLFGGDKPVVTGVTGGVSATKDIYLSMITDGDNNDKVDFEKELAKLPYTTFLQIIAIGTDVKKTYLDSLAEKFENVSVIYLPNPKAVTQDKFYDMLINSDFKKFTGV